MIPVSILIAAAVVFGSGLLFNEIGIRLAHRFRILDIPSARRRHSKPTPIVGGLCIFTSWFAGLAAFSVLRPEWALMNAQGLFAISAGVAILIGAGLWDDVKGMGPSAKLLCQVAAAVIVLSFEPHCRQVVLEWQRNLGIGVLIWPMAVIWIVGISNAVNLIDGLDGLAGGTSLLVTASIVALSLWNGDKSTFVAVLMGLLLPSIGAFLKNNWNPARIFLGDNGSLPLGFLIATMSPICRPTSYSWVMIVSIVLMLGYPILDMGLAVWHRYRKGMVLFKADRNHLHYRVQRLGLSPRDTVCVLLGMTAFLQATALGLNLMDDLAAISVIFTVTLSLVTFLFLVGRVEQRNVKLMVDRAKVAPLSEVMNALQSAPVVLFIELRPLFTVGLFEEKERFHILVDSLRQFLRTQVRPEDFVVDLESEVGIVFNGFVDTPENRETVRRRFESKVTMFLDLAEFHGSLAGLPMRWRKPAAARPTAELETAKAS